MSGGPKMGSGEMSLTALGIWPRPPAGAPAARTLGRTPPHSTRAQAPVAAARGRRAWSTVCAKINGSCSWDPRREQPEGAGAHAGRRARAARGTRVGRRTVYFFFVMRFLSAPRGVARDAPRRQRARSRTPRAKGGCARAVACATTVHRLYNASRGRPGGGSRTRRPTHRLDRRDPTQHHAPRSGVDSSAHIRHSSDALAALTAIHVSAVCGPRGAAPRRRTGGCSADHCVVGGGEAEQRSRARAARWVPPQQLGRCACRRRSRRPGGARAGHVRRAAQWLLRAHA